MSFTIMRVRDGKFKPVTVSIWDAFRGAPAPSRRSSRSTAKAEISLSNDEKKDEGAREKIDEEKQGEKQIANKEGIIVTNSTGDAESYTEQDDAKIIEMKNDGSTWAAILKAVGKTSKPQLQAHWKKDLQYRASSTDEVEKEDNSADKDKAEGKNKKQEPETKDDEPKPKEAELYANAPERKRERKSKKASKRELQADEASRKLNEGHNQIGCGRSASIKADNRIGMGAPTEKHDQHKWIAAASKHFDRTGQRISPLEARRMAEGKEK